MHMKKYISTVFLFFIIHTSAFSQQNFCQGSDASNWNNCIGTLNDPENKNGKKYTGPFINGLPNGEGEIVFDKSPNEIGQMKYIGNVKNWKYEGYGVMTYPHTKEFKKLGRYSGYWKDGKKDGYGIWEFPNGTTQECIWRGNECVRLAPKEGALKSVSYDKCINSCTSPSKNQQCMIKESVEVCNSVVKTCIQSCFIGNR
jgi:hypothetical protein